MPRFENSVQKYCDRDLVANTVAPRRIRPVEVPNNSCQVSGPALHHSDESSRFALAFADEAETISHRGCALLRICRTHAQAIEVSFQRSGCTNDSSPT